MKANKPDWHNQYDLFETGNLIFRFLANQSVKQEMNVENFEEFSHFITHHQIAPLFQRFPIASFASNSQQAQFAGFVEKAYHQTLHANLLRYRFFNELIDNCAKEKIPVLGLKGIILSQTLYANPGHRPMGDIDLMIHSKHRMKFHRIMKKMGFEPELHSRFQRISVHDLFGGMVYFNPDTGHRLDVHEQLYSPFLPFAVQTNDVFERSETLTVQGGSIQTLSIEDHLLFLTYHTLYAHRLSPLKNYLDLVLFIHTYHSKMDYDRLICSAREANLTRLSRIAMGLYEGVNPNFSSPLLPDNNVDNDVEHYKSLIRSKKMGGQSSDISLSNLRMVKGLGNKVLYGIRPFLYIPNRKSKASGLFGSGKLTAFRNIPDYTRALIKLIGPGKKLNQFVG